MANDKSTKVIDGKTYVLYAGRWHVKVKCRTSATQPHDVTCDRHRDYGDHFRNGSNLGGA